MRARGSYDDETSDESLLSGAAVGDDRAVLVINDDSSDWP